MLDKSAEVCYNKDKIRKGKAIEMKKRELKHPRKVMWAMRDFMNRASNLTYEVIYFPSTEECDKNGWDFFDHYYTEERPRECRMRNFTGTPLGFCAINCDDEELEIFEIGYNIDQLNGKGNAQFRKHFENLCPMARGFADVTISLLHELGHFSTEQKFEGYDRRTEIEFLEKHIPKEVINYAYFMLPDEMAATLWAVEWLQNAENRKIAKAFEKKFFACFEK